MDTPNDVSISNPSLCPIVSDSEEDRTIIEVDDQLKFIENVMKEVHNTINAEKKENSMSKETFNNLTNILDLYFRLNYDQRILLGNKLAECNAGPMLIQYINILTEHGNCYPLEGYKYNCCETVLVLCLNFTDANPTFSSSLCEDGIISMMFSILKEFKDNFSENKVKLRLAELAMTLLHNCAGVTPNKKYFCNEPDMVEVVAWYAKHTSQEVNKNLALLSIITLAEIVEEKNNDVILADDTIIQTLLNLLGDSLKDSEHRAEGYSVTELISGLSRLANNKENSVVIVEHGILKYIRLILKEGDDIEKSAAAEAVWALAFSDKNKKKILDDNEIISALKAVSDCSDKDKPQKLRVSASWALWVLNQKHGNKGKKRSQSLLMSKAASFSSIKKESAALEEEANDFLIDAKEQLDEALKCSQKPFGHIMISYQWGCQELMVKVKNRLENDGYKVWIDMEEMGGSTLQAMADAVENAAVILISMSRKYKESKNCRTEAEYAYDCDVPIIPIKVEDGYKPDGWLGAIVGAKFYVNLSDYANFAEVYKTLTKEIGERGKLIQASTVCEFDAPVCPPVTEVTDENSKTATSVKDWIRADVKLWKKQNEIEKLKTKSLNGKALVFLKKLQKNAPEFFYQFASNQLGLKDIQNLMKFSNAIEELQ